MIQEETPPKKASSVDKAGALFTSPASPKPARQSPAKGAEPDFIAETYYEDQEHVAEPLDDPQVRKMVENTVSLASPGRLPAAGTTKETLIQDMGRMMALMDYDTIMYMLRVAVGCIAISH